MTYSPSALNFVTLLQKTYVFYPKLISSRPQLFMSLEVLAPRENVGSKIKFDLKMAKILKILDTSYTSNIIPR